MSGPTVAAMPAGMLEMLMAQQAQEKRPEAELIPVEQAIKAYAAAAVEQERLNGLACELRTEMDAHEIVLDKAKAELIKAVIYQETGKEDIRHTCEHKEQDEPAEEPEPDAPEFGGPGVYL
jgi:hypothetical protein